MNKLLVPNGDIFHKTLNNSLHLSRIAKKEYFANILITINSKTDDTGAIKFPSIRKH